MNRHGARVHLEAEEYDAIVRTNDELSKHNIELYERNRSLTEQLENAMRGWRKDSDSKQAEIDLLSGTLRNALAILNRDESRPARLARLNAFSIAMLDQMERDSQSHYDLEKDGNALD